MKPNNQTSNGVNNLPAPSTEGPSQNFIIWHYQQELPHFIKQRILQIADTAKIFNTAGLVKNLFAPYKRLAITGKSQKFGAKDLFDKLTFNIISSFVGAGVRVILLGAWIIAFVIAVIFSLFAIVFWTIFPFASINKFIKTCNNYFFENDLKDTSKFSNKLKKSRLLCLLCLFFEEDFKLIFNSLPEPIGLDIKTGQKLEEVMLALAKNWQTLKKYLTDNNINPKDFEILVKHIANDLQTPNLLNLPIIGGTLSYGYTNTLDRFSNEITDNRLSSPQHIKFLENISKVLNRLENNNVLLVGEPGVGKHNLISELAAQVKRLQIKSLIDKRLMLLDTVSLAGSGKTLIEAKNSFEAVLAEAKAAGNIILVIDHIDQVASAKDSRIDLTDVLALTLNNNNLPIIGIATPENFNKYIRPNSSFLKLFEKLDVEEATIEETKGILIGKTLEAYQREKIRVGLGAIVEIVAKSEKLLQDRRQPDKSILILEDAISEAKSRNLNIVNQNLVDELLSEKTHTPVGQITQSEAQKLKDLEGLLHKRIIGQNEAIDEIAKAMRRARAEVEVGNRPIGSFLFLGPTGVGKTETSKALAEAYFGAEDKMVRFDMSEFQDEDSLKKLIGDVDRETPGRLATEIRQNPYCLLLIDEFEKSTESVQNLFLQILDEGFLTDSFGKKVKFANVIIIATSNAGAEYIRESLQRSLLGKEGSLSKKLIEYVLSKGLFNPELINRFDGVIVYKPLNQQQVVEVTKLMLTNLSVKLQETKNITLEISDELAKKVAAEGFDPQFGPRPIRRLIQDKIEDGIAKMIIDGTAKSGSAISSATLVKFLS